MDQNELEDLWEEWAQVLRLQDWSVRLLFVESHAFNNNELADCNIDLKRKKATIRVLHPDEPNPDHPLPRDVEADLVHECLHLWMAPFEATDWNSPTGVAQEQMIEILATSFVALKRAAKRSRKK